MSIITKKATPMLYSDDDSKYIQEQYFASTSSLHILHRLQPLPVPYNGLTGHLSMNIRMTMSSLPARMTIRNNNCSNWLGSAKRS